MPDFSDGDPMDSAGFMILKTVEISSETLKHLKKPPAVFFKVKFTSELPTIFFEDPLRMIR